MSDVTTVVITRNRREQLLETVARHSGPVIVIDNASSDGSRAAVEREFPEVSVIGLSTNQGAVARNIGVRAARTRYVAFADDDSWWSTGMLDRAAAIFDASPTVVLLAASVLVGPEKRPDSFGETLSRSPLSGIGDLPGVPVLGFMSCACVVRRQPFLDVGGFDTVVEFAGEEERLALDLADAGWALRYVADLVVRHEPSSSRSASRRRSRRLARNDVLTALMRRPMRIVLRRAAGYAVRDLDGVAGVLAALWRSPRALMQRRLLSQRVENRARQLDSVN